MSVPQCVADRVDKGARLLDAECPAWHINVDPTRLSMTSLTFCVLGQLFHEFNAGLTALLPDVDSDELEARYAFAVEHGFESAYDHGEDLNDIADAWRTEINTRRWSARPGNLAFAGGAA